MQVNRVLRQLREEGLCAFQKGRVTLDDYDGLVALAGFDRTYLDHDGPLLHLHPAARADRDCRAPADCR